MTPFDQFIAFLAQGLPGFDPWLIIKIFVLIALFLYLAFAVIVLRQVMLMDETVKSSLGGLFKLLAAVHLVAVVLIFFLSLWLL
ncbi:MAG: DUF5657 family protein [Candidatus Shapirobacteria bacterium]